MAAGFFRKEALEKLSTPEKLDQLIKVTSPKGWIALLTIALALGTGIAWSFFGDVKTKLNVVGVLLGGEIYEVVATSQGQLINLNVNIGDAVTEGDIIATIEQPELLQQIEDVEASLKEQKYDLQRLISFGNKNTKMQEQILEKEHLFIGIQQESSEATLKYLKSQLENEKKLLKKGLITKSQVVNTEQQIEETLANIEYRKVQTVQATNIQLNNYYDHEKRININKQLIEETKRRLNHLKERYDIQTNIRSSYNGEVVELLSEPGIVVNQGAPLFKLKNQNTTTSSEGKLRGVLYIPSQDGKKIKEGMEAFVVPSTVQPQEYGFMKGKVTYVSDFPITQKGMMMTVKNDLLVSGLLTQGALFEVYVEFEEDKETFSGFKWTSVGGPEIAIKEGTSCMGKITVKTEPPATMVVPALKKFFDLY